MTTASVTLATSAGWQAGHAGVETDDAPPVMTADNWNVTDFYMIAAQLRTHTRGLQTNVRPGNGSNRAEHEGGTWRMQAGILLRSPHSRDNLSF